MNLIYSTNFAEGFYDYKDEGALTVPNGWTPDWINTEGPGQFHRPEYDMKSRSAGHPEILPGKDFAATVMQSNSTGHSCIFRQFTVQPGEIFAFAKVMVKSHEDAGHGLVIGIDPYGGEDFIGKDVILGNWWSQYMDEMEPKHRNEEWWEITIDDAEAKSSVITVFLISKNDHPAQWAAGIWGEFSLWDSREPGGGNEFVKDLEELRKDLERLRAEVDRLIVKYR
ncbi:MAG: hypothetical protein ACXABY_33800 [Candidatus Thorarchaeota archaeon]|jgi:hypothetical protein